MNKFVIVYDDDTLRAVTESVVSRMYDLADCDAMDGVREIYGIDESGKLVPIRIGTLTRHGYGSDSDVYYGTSPIYAGKRTVGFIHHTDH